MDANTFKLHSLDSNNDLNDLSSDVSMFGVADYNPSINDASSIWSFGASSMAPTIGSTATLNHSEKWSGFDSLSMVDLSAFGSNHTGTSEFSYSQHMPQEQDVESRAAEQVLLCAACLVQTQIYNDVLSKSDGSGQPPRAIYTEFNAIPDLPLEFGGPCRPSKIPHDVLLRERQSDEKMYEEILAGRVPTVDTIFKYMMYVKTRAGYSTECNVFALIYINKMCTVTTHQGSATTITAHTWRAIWTMSIIVAQKMYEENPIRTSLFAQILPSISKELLWSMELKVLTFLDFSTAISPDMYERYVNELRALYVSVRENIMPSMENVPWALMPLTLEKIQRLESRALNAWGEGSVHLENPHIINTNPPLGHGSNAMMNMATTDTSNGGGHVNGVRPPRHR